jgi:hypothetical protein
VKENVSGGNGVGNRKPTIIRPSPSYQKDGNKQAGEMRPRFAIPAIDSNPPKIAADEKSAH